MRIEQMYRSDDFLTEENQENMPEPSIFASGVGCSVYTKYKIKSHKIVPKLSFNWLILLVKKMFASYDSSLDSDFCHFITGTLPY